MTPARSFLLDQLTVTPLDDGQVAVTVTLPPELVKDYCRFLESLAGFFQVAHRKSRLALVASRATSQTADLDGYRTLTAFRARLVKAFDFYTSRGSDRKEAVQLIAADLRAEGHPWRSIDQMRATLVEAGHSRRSGPWWSSWSPSSRVTYSSETTKRLDLKWPNLLIYLVGVHRIELWTPAV